MSFSDIDLSCNGAIKLGIHVTCDGFVDSYGYRVQTHIHDDHMNQFDTSKHFQTIIMSEATRSLLEIRHAEMPYSTNIITQPLNIVQKYDDLTIELKSSTHMLGAVQVAVTNQLGETFGYSGDFSWPLDDIIHVKNLVLDSTYGSPKSVRRYTQEDAHEAFKEILLKKIKHGPVVIKGHRGTLYRALELLDGLVKCPIVASRKKIDEAKVCEKFGYSICSLMDLDLPKTRKLRKDGPYIELRYIGEQSFYEPGNSTVITLSAGWVHGTYPYLEISDSAYKIAISDHADFNETLEFVKETGAKFVLTDSVRGDKAHAAELANAITKKLGISAKPAKPVYSKEWGV